MVVTIGSDVVKIGIVGGGVVVIEIVTGGGGVETGVAVVVTGRSGKSVGVGGANDKRCRFRRGRKSTAASRTKSSASSSTILRLPLEELGPINLKRSFVPTL